MYIETDVFFINLLQKIYPNSPIISENFIPKHHFVILLKITAAYWLIQFSNIFIYLKRLSFPNEELTFVQESLEGLKIFFFTMIYIFLNLKNFDTFI